MNPCKIHHRSKLKKPIIWKTMTLNRYLNIEINIINQKDSFTKNNP